MNKFEMTALDWASLYASLNEQGYAKTPLLLSPSECAQLIELYDEPDRFRNTVHMARYRFGEGEYKYFAAPLPDLVTELRSAFYPPLAQLANDWAAQLGQAENFPHHHADFLKTCHAQGQSQSTPLLLRYEAGGYNCLHQDLYGDVAFPFQVVFVLNQHGHDYTGGEFLLVEQRPRAQSRGHVITLEQGQGLIFPTRYRPMQGTRGFYRVTLRHGVSTLHTGKRYSLGVIFHDAK